MRYRNIVFRDLEVRKEDTIDIIETMNAAEATEWLRARGMKISQPMLVRGIKAHEFPFGSVIPPEKDGEAPRTFIFTVLMEDWAAARMRRHD